MGQFAIDVAKWAEKAKGNADQVVRVVAIQMLVRVVMRSPVGNPELWAANAEAVLRRSEHNAVVDTIDSYLKQNPDNLTKRGNLKRKVKRNHKLGKSELARAYPLVSGDGYVGGRFRGNWFTSVSAASKETTEAIDPSGATSIARGSSALADFKAGPSIFVTNNLPYALRLEYEGWSKQAPAGMVRITVAEFGPIVAAAVAELPP